VVLHDVFPREFLASAFLRPACGRTAGTAEPSPIH
jgi:hypothetical protein